MWHLSEEGNTLGLDKKKTTAIRNASCCFLVLSFCADSIFDEVAGFSPLWFPRGKTLCSLSLVFIAMLVILSVKDPNNAILMLKN